jgi:hypothetical protein
MILKNCPSCIDLAGNFIDLAINSFSMCTPVLTYFNTLEQRPLERLLFLVGGMLVLWLAEGAIPYAFPPL